MLYEEICAGELQPITDLDASIRDSFSDGSDALILVYQKLVEDVEEFRSINSPEVAPDNTVDSPGAPLPAVLKPECVPHNTSIQLRNRCFRRPYSKLLNSRHSLCQRARKHLLARIRRRVRKVSKKSLSSIANRPKQLKRLSIQAQQQRRRRMQYPTDFFPSSCQFAPHFFRELVTRVPIEFYELRFPWSLLNSNNLCAGFAIILPLIGDKCLLPGIPLANKASFPAQCLFATVAAKAPSFTVRLSLKHSFRYILALLASYLSIKIPFIQLFKPRCLSSGSGGGLEKEFFAIPSSFCGNLQSILSALDHQQRSSTPSNLFRQQGLQPPPTPKNCAAPVPLYYQCLSIPAGEMDRLCQLRCVFVDSARVHEVAKLIVVVSRSSNVAELLEVARVELMRIGLLDAVISSTASSSASSPSTSSLEKVMAPENAEEGSQNGEDTVIPLRLLETLNSWIIQQYPGDMLASQLQVR